MTTIIYNWETKKKLPLISIITEYKFKETCKKAAN